MSLTKVSGDVIQDLIDIGAITVTNVNSSGISTFSNGPVLIGTATSTGTASQRLQVTGGAYVSGNLGIGTTNPGEKLQVDGNMRLGVSATSNYLAFYGTTGDNPGQYNHTYIGERIWSSGLEKSELFLFKGNDADTTTGQDRIRLAGGQIRLDTYTTATGGASFESIATSANLINRVVVHSTGEVGIGSDVLTGTASQRLQVTGGAYVSDSVGIGTTNPQNPLHISGNAGTLLRIDGGAAGTGTRDIVITEFNTAAYGGIIRYDSVQDTFTVGTLENSVVQYALNIARATGNVGVGYAQPNATVKLAVNGTTLINTNSLTGTASQSLQVTGGAYVSGNLGVGVTSPSTKLDVAGIIRLRRNDSSFEGGEIQFTRAVDDATAFIFDVYGNTAANSRLRLFSGVTGSEIFTVDTGNNFIIGAASSTGTASQRLQVTGGAYVSGSVGIGTTNPNADLTILKTVAGGNGALLSIQNRSAISGTKCGIMFGVDGSDAFWGDVGNAQIIMENTSGSSTGQLKFRVYDGVDSEAMKIVGDGGGNLRNGVAFARAGVAIDNSWDGYPGIVVFATDGYGNSTNRTEFRIHGFGHTYAAYPGAPAADFGTNLRIDGSTYFSSDQRHKTNIVDNPYGLNEVLQLQPRKFNRINSSGEIEENQGDILGFIAQEVKEVIPEAVNYYPDEDIPNEIGWCRAYSLSDGYIVSTLVNAVKEQNAIIESLKSRIEVLESQINT